MEKSQLEVFSGNNDPTFLKFYQKLMHGIFLIFCMKLQQHKNLKLVQMVFLEKLYFEILGRKVAKNGPKIKFFKIYEKSETGNKNLCGIWVWEFSDFFAWSCSSWRLKMDSNNIFGKNLLPRISGKKWLKISFLNLTTWWIKVTKSQQHCGWKLGKIVWTKLFLWFMGHKEPKLGPK